MAQFTNYSTSVFAINGCLELGILIVLWWGIITNYIEDGGSILYAL